MRPRFVFFSENFRDATKTNRQQRNQLVAMGNLTSNILLKCYKFGDLADLQTLLQSMKQKCQKQAQVCTMEKQSSFPEIQYYWTLPCLVFVNLSGLLWPLLQCSALSRLTIQFKIKHLVHNIKQEISPALKKAGEILS